MTEHEPLPDRICPRHGTPFTPRRANQEFCSPECKNAAHREAKGFGDLLIRAGIITRAQLRVLYEALDAVGDTDALIELIRAQHPYTADADHHEEDRP